MAEEEKKEEEKKEEEKPEEKVEEAPEEAKPAGRWYVIQTLSGQEEKVKSNIERSVETMGLKDKIFQVLIPTEETVEIRNGKRTEKVRKMYPGYIFVEMMLDEETWYEIRQTPGVARFIGGRAEPTPVSDQEMQRVLKQLGVKEAKIELKFEKGESVRIIRGPFRGYTGTVDEVHPDKEKIKALINIFGRDTPVEIEFDQAEKIV